MSKNTLVGILTAAAFLTMACLCCPTNLLSYISFSSPATSTEVPAALPSTDTIEPTSASTDMKVCSKSLSQILHDSEYNFPSGQEFETDFTLVTYTVSGDSLSDPVYVTPLRDSLKTYQQDTATQEKMWKFVTDIIPADQRTLLDQFAVFTDGVSNSLGAVEQTDNPHYWKLELDILDAKNFPDLATTLIHEFAHLLSLNDSQVVTDRRVFNNPDDQAIYDEEAAACSTYFLFEGCSKPNSYLNTFFDRFWPDIYDEWKVINAETDQDVINQKLDSFYQEYADQFVSDYAATSPEEDLAETFMFFIFNPKPTGTSIADQKVLFFYDYPELVHLRDRLLANLCAHLETP
jgi:hypothetical protein